MVIPWDHLERSRAYADHHREVYGKIAQSIFNRFEIGTRERQRSRRIRLERENVERREKQKNARILPPYVKDVIRQVARDHDLTLDDVVGVQRYPKIIAARKAAIVALRINFPGKSIGWYRRAFGYRSHDIVRETLAAKGLYTVKPPPYERHPKTMRIAA